jgi:4a-hydroxytetrahydrobiopterin dehydratase
VGLQKFCKPSLEAVMARHLLAPEALAAGLSTLHSDWSGDRGMLARTIEFADFSAAVQFIVILAPMADALDHHPDLHLSWRTLVVELTTHSAGGVTELDLQLAAAIDEAIN